ncbi:DUF2269 family protein [Tabrizicola sp.]|uniref:DUF2269 family protein n=1 Tax=Tabrizicola sp. TaxID=2005166 RepID=UPI003F38A084
MDLSTLLKFFHVIVAILWVGGGFAFILAGFILTRRAPAAEQVSHIRTVALLGPRFFMPVSIATLISGLALLFHGGWGWQPFTILGLAGVAFTTAFGMLVIAPSSERAVKFADTYGPAAALPTLRRLYRLAVIDYAVQFAIVFLMVAKPSWEDLAFMVPLALTVLIALAAAILPAPSRTTRA